MLKISAKKFLPVSLVTTLLALAPPAFSAHGDTHSPMEEAMALMKAQSGESGRPHYTPETAVTFPDGYNVYLKSVMEIDFTFRKANATIPLYRGKQGNGDDAYYILTEASDKDVAEAMGLNHAPKMARAIGSSGVQKVTLEDGIMIFQGNVDFSPERKIAPGPDIFPPAVAMPGAMADMKWSSIVVTPQGTVYNAQIVANKTGTHDRLEAIDRDEMTVTLSILDGFQDGKEFFYHLVTDASVGIAAALENGVLAPRLQQLPTLGDSSENSSLLGFSPVLNGISDISTGEDQGFTTLLANGGIDPINVFPYGPEHPNYSPLWDAHVSQWTQAAIDQDKVRRIISFEDLEKLINEGLVESASISPEGPGNAWLFGLSPTKAIINCPVIAHPDASVVKMN